MKRVSVFCGSSLGNDTIYKQEAFQLGKTLAQKGIGLVYGGAHIGLMGAVADGALSESGEVIGVIPNFLRSKEIAHEGISELILTDTMHQRKSKMNDLCDAVIVLPGGFGTLDEYFEMLTWGQLGLHQKPLGILNTNGYYNHLINHVETMAQEGFLSEDNKSMVIIESEINMLLETMASYQSPKTGKWVDEQKI
ncbi:TIGR00730 family Rossman fold protein [Mangrovimonas sp. AS39]|uniref:LOG family protein n=1 Tax=Mangrovimonas futianensis TaxID=2895523 RepID=UPI001E39889F|nr:TIGR00730 family Rossman fold protein [Mangrovimonas futianensis]MCF1192843.1 TIGR00730 family Rossman fold protein [Mangrovimonas futianensis]MCF1196555.1 TIGR00730 family Rossman fold protein [Mangrovimonas futianensis]